MEDDRFVLVVNEKVDEIGVKDRFTKDIIVEKTRVNSNVINYNMSLISLLNSLEANILIKERVLNDFMGMVDNFQSYFKSSSDLKNLSEDDYKELLKLADISRDMLDNMNAPISE